MRLTLTVLGGLSTPAIIAIAAVALVAVVLLMRSSRKKSSESANEIVSIPVADAPSSTEQYAPGSSGEIKLYNVKDKQAALIMAIVADHLMAPLNTLRFKSIKRID